MQTTKAVSGTVRVCLANLSVFPRMIEAILAAQQFDPFVPGIWRKMEAGEVPHFSVGVNGGLRYDMRQYVPQMEEVK